MICGIGCGGAAPYAATLIVPELALGATVAVVVVVGAGAVSVAVGIGGWPYGWTCEG